jgi:carbamoyltransferase
MANIIGISAYYHDSAACLVRDGEIIAAAQEERFTRKKHDSAFPKEAVAYCLKAGGITAAQLDFVGFYDKPLRKFERLLESYLGVAPQGLKSFLTSMPVWIKDKLFTRQAILAEFDGFNGELLFAEHHESHAASAFYPSPFQEAAVLTMDGVGEWATSSYAVGKGEQLDLLAELHYPHSLGMLYSAFTYYTGFKVNSGEYKVMGLAPYGEPKYADLIMNKVMELRDDGSFKLDMKYFNYLHGLTMTSPALDDLLGGPPRKGESEVTQREMDLAASIQVVTEEVVGRMARHVQRETGMENLCLAGGVALNCVANGKLLKSGPFKRLWIQPAAGDAGGAVGVALTIAYKVAGAKRTVLPGDSMKGSYLGPVSSDAEIQQYLDSVGAKYRRCATSDEMLDETAKRLATRKSSAGCRAGWNSDPAHSVAGASWATRAPPRCSRS